MKRVELFKKVLPPKYISGDEIKLRTYTIIDKKKADEVLKEEALNLAAYKRPFSQEEEGMFLYLFDYGYFDKKADIACRDNIFRLLARDINFAKRLDKKDLVKFSLIVFGDFNHGLEETYKRHKDEREVKALMAAVNLVKDCPLTKRQSKYFNKLVKLSKGVKGKEDNHQSPYVIFERLMKKGQFISAAEFLKNEGSLLERNLKYILSRCEDEYQLNAVLGLLESKNPAVLFQILSSLMDDAKGNRRVFKFTKIRIARTHIETSREAKYRQSCLTNKQKRIVKNILLDKIEYYYLMQPKIGKFYINEEFKKVALPINTSTSGRGVDVLPSGSRIKFEGDFLRIFCHWDGVRDIDASLVFLKEKELPAPMTSLNDAYLSWRNYHSSPFEECALCSGDDTSENGTEYQDIDIKGILDKGYRYAFACINGYGELFNKGTIIQGLQIKKHLDTKAWDPKNIEFQMNIVGDCRSFTGFAVDLLNKEIIIINTLTNCGPVVEPEQVNVARRYVSDYYLEFNMYSLLALIGNKVNTPEEAEYVFDSKYQPKDDSQKVIRPYDIAALTALVNIKKE